MTQFRLNFSVRVSASVSFPPEAVSSPAASPALDAASTSFAPRPVHSSHPLSSSRSCNASNAVALYLLNEPSSPIAVSSQSWTTSRPAASLFPSGAPCDNSSTRDHVCRKRQPARLGRRGQETRGRCASTGPCASSTRVQWPPPRRVHRVRAPW